ncbi:CDI toxin immunity protein [Priestia flexa]|uniref:CDI toxin immunity protein n=1 Tax=Priestia TaxID=2800373 RepID=UPI003CFF9C04
MNTKGSDHQLFDECIETLGENTVILSNEKSQAITNLIEEKFPISVSGKVDWSNIENHLLIQNREELLPRIKQRVKDFEDRVYLIWDDN